MMSANFLDFFDAPTPVCIFTNLPLLASLTLSAFHGPSLPFGLDIINESPQGRCSLPAAHCTLRRVSSVSAPLPSLSKSPFSLQCQCFFHFIPLITLAGCVMLLHALARRDIKLLHCPAGNFWHKFDPNISLLSVSGSPRASAKCWLQLFGLISLPVT